MKPQTAQDYQALITEVIKKQIVILGPDITLAKARNVAGLTIGNDGTVTGLAGDPQVIIQALIDQFVQLSGLIVKKTMEPLLMNTASNAAAAAAAPQQPLPAAPPPVQPAPVSQPAASGPVVIPAPVNPVQPVNPQPAPPPAPQSSAAQSGVGLTQPAQTSNNGTNPANGT